MKEEKTSTRKLNFKEWLKKMTIFTCEALNITEREMDMLTKRIEGSKGIVRVFMHPLTIGNDFLEEGDAVGDADKIINVLSKCIAQNAKYETTPLNFIMFEDNSNFEMAVDEIERCGIEPAKNGTIVFKTFNDEGRPSEEFWRLVKNNRNLLFQRPLGFLKDRKEAIVYLAFFEILRCLGVKKIVAYGGYIDLSDPDEEGEYNLDRCLGLFITYARINKIQVVISNNTIHRGSTKQENEAKGIVYKDD